jgi:type I restriction enzyme R subunit
MKPEERARQRIDHLLEEAGWDVQDFKEMNLGSSLGIAIREFPLKTGFADYLLFVDRKAAGVIEAKPEGATLSGVSYQSGMYTEGIPDDIPCAQKPLPFAYESTGVETFFRDQRDPDP